MEFKQHLKKTGSPSTGSPSTTAVGFYDVRTPGFYDPKYFHFIGELSPVAELFIPKPIHQGGFTNQRRIERREVSDERLNSILNDGASETVDLELSHWTGALNPNIRAYGITPPFAPPPQYN